MSDLVNVLIHQITFFSQFFKAAQLTISSYLKADIFVRRKWKCVNESHLLYRQYKSFPSH